MGNNYFRFYKDTNQNCYNPCFAGFILYIFPLYLNSAGLVGIRLGALHVSLEACGGLVDIRG